MPTSATGAEARASPEAGFTLVELMVAIVVMGLLTAVIVLNVPEPGGRLADEADGLAARLRRAQEEAILTNRTVEVTMNRAGYAFRVQQPGGWAPLDDGPFAGRRWREGTDVSIRQVEGRSAVRFDSTGAADPAEISLTRKARQMRVIVDGQGQVSVDARAG
ncbi:MAG: GspH/FimT family pseudopilin [Phenylobacterium sp.]